MKRCGVCRKGHRASMAPPGVPPPCVQLSICTLNMVFWGILWRLNCTSMTADRMGGEPQQGLSVQLLLDLCAAHLPAGAGRTPLEWGGVLGPAIGQGKSENFFKASSEAERKNWEFQWRTLGKRDSGFGGLPWGGRDEPGAVEENQTTYFVMSHTCLSL